MVTDSIFAGNWQLPEGFIGDKVLFSIGDTSFTQKDFLEELYTTQHKQTPEYIPLFLEKMFNSITDKKVLEYADNKLEERFPELKETMDAFREGILIFAITDKEVWNKSLTDSIGLANFYEQHKAEYNWQDRADVTTWNIDKSIDLKKATKIIAKYSKKNKTNDQTREYLLKKFSITEKPDKYFSYSWGRYEKGANKNIDKLIWNTPLANDFKKENVILSDTTLMTNKNNVFVLKRFVAPQPKTLDECKGVVTSQYQEVLERNWIESLRRKYTYTVNYDVFNSIK